MNDGSEETSDMFKLIALTENNKQSCAFDVRVKIVSVNDETPIVAANTGLCVWEGGTFALTRNELCKCFRNVMFHVCNESRGGFICHRLEWIAIEFCMDSVVLFYYSFY